MYIGIDPKKSLAYTCISTFYNGYVVTIKFKLK